IALAATLEAWGERLPTASPVPLSAVPVDGIAVGGALALEGGGHVVGPAETDGLARRVTLRSATLARTDPDVAQVTAGLDAGTRPYWPSDVPQRAWGSEATLAAAAAELAAVKRDTEGGGGESLPLPFEGGPSARVELVLPAADGGREHLRLHGPGTARSTGAGPTVQGVLRERGASRADPEPVFGRAQGDVVAVGDLLARAGTAARMEPESTAQATSAQDPAGAEALELPDG